MRLSDRIWREMSERNLTGIDDIEKIQMTPYGLKLLKEEYFQEFGEKVVDKQDISEHLGCSIELVSYLGEGIQYKIYEEY